MNGVRGSLLSVVVGLALLTGCAGAQADDEINFLREKRTDGSSMMALWRGKLVLTNGCLRVQDVRTSYAVIWPFAFDFSVHDGNINILNGDDQVVAEVGDQIRVSGGELPSMSPKRIEQLATGGSQCSGPYWLAGYEVTVLTP